MEVILKQEIRRLGNKGDVVRVADGYARNYLFPQQLAMPATAANKQQIEQMQQAAEREALRLKGDARKLADVLEGLAVTLTARAGEADQLFGSVTSRDIAAELERMGYEIDRHKVVIHNPIRMIGEHEVSIHLHRDVDVSLKVTVLAEGREEEAAAEVEVPEEADDGESASDATPETVKPKKGKKES